jgi:hypothetical protein
MPYAHRNDVCHVAAVTTGTARLARGRPATNSRTGATAWLIISSVMPR